MIKVSGVSKKFGDLEILKDINIEFEANKTYAIIGASGSGKSTLAIDSSNAECITLVSATYG